MRLQMSRMSIESLPAPRDHAFYRLPLNGSVGIAWKLL